MKNKKMTKSEILDLVKGMFIHHELMFLYYSGSDAYGTGSESSDTDVTAVFKTIKGIIHASAGDIDVFAYGYDDFLARQSISDEVPLYNLIHADDIINIDKNLIYVNEQYKKEFESITKLDFYKVLPLYLEAFIKYNDDLLNVQNVVVKREYHILRLRAIIDEVIKTKKYQITISDEWLAKIKKHKKDFRKLNTPKYLDELRGYLEEIITIKNDNFKGDEYEV